VGEAALQYVADGLVLNRSGTWVQIGEALSEYEDLCRHVCLGQVRRNGLWISIEQAIADGGIIDSLQECSSYYTFNRDEKNTGNPDIQETNQDTKVIDIQSLM
jgi:hypothetical protein